MWRKTASLLLLAGFLASQSLKASVALRPTGSRGSGSGPKQGSSTGLAGAVLTNAVQGAVAGGLVGAIGTPGGLTTGMLMGYVAGAAIGVATYYMGNKDHFALEMYPSTSLD